MKGRDYEMVGMKLEKQNRRANVKNSLLTMSENDFWHLVDGTGYWRINFSALQFNLCL